MNELELYHHGILGQRWGFRRFQNKDGSLTPAGKKRLAKLQNSDGSLTDKGYKRLSKYYNLSEDIVLEKFNKLSKNEKKLLFDMVDEHSKHEIEIKTGQNGNSNDIKDKVNKAMKTNKFDMEFLERELDLDPVTEEPLSGKALRDAYEKYLMNKSSS